MTLSISESESESVGFGRGVFIHDDIRVRGGGDVLVYTSPIVSFLAPSRLL